jgi:hypothetical protein
VCLLSVIRRIRGARSLDDTQSWRLGGRWYTDRHGEAQGLVASEDNGARGRVIQVPGLRALNAGGAADAGLLSCPSPGNCAVGGAYAGRSGHDQGFVVTQAI